MDDRGAFLADKSVFLTLLLTLLSGCTMAPSYQRPSLPVADHWPLGAAGQPVPTQDRLASDIEWQHFFTEPKLQALIRLSLTHNRDLRVAALNIEAARAQYQIQRAALFPAINATGTGLGQRTPQSLRAPGQPAVTRQYTAGMGFSAFELDLFGRLTSLKDQALESYFAQEETRRSVQISLLAEVANAWYTLLANRDRLLLAECTLNARAQSYTLIDRQFALGVASELDLNQADSLLQSARSDVASYTAQLAQAEHALTLLVGTSLPTELTAGITLQSQKELADLPVGLPSEVLMSRPDILAAEHQLKAANANIGEARARFFPSISLTGSVGSASTNLSDLFKGGNGAWSFGPSINLPLFAAGSHLANLESSKVQRDISVAQYEKAIQTAFREVSDALAQRATIEDQWKAEQAVLVATQRNYNLSNARYQTGVDSYLTLLNVQQALYSAEQAVISTRLSKLATQVTLYKVLGGGWQLGSQS